MYMQRLMTSSAMTHETGSTRVEDVRMPTKGCRALVAQLAPRSLSRAAKRGRRAALPKLTDAATTRSARQHGRDLELAVCVRHAAEELDHHRRACPHARQNKHMLSV